MVNVGKSNSYLNIDLDRTILNIKLVQDIFIHNNISKFHVFDGLSFMLSCKNPDKETDAHSEGLLIELVKDIL